MLSVTAGNTNLGGVILSITDTKIFYACLLQNFNGEVGPFCAKVVEMIVSECNGVKSSKPNKKRSRYVSVAGTWSYTK